MLARNRAGCGSRIACAETMPEYEGIQPQSQDGVAPSRARRMAGSRKTPSRRLCEKFHKFILPRFCPRLINPFRSILGAALAP